MSLLLRHSKIIKVDDVKMENGVFVPFDVVEAVRMNLPPPKEMAIRVTMRHWFILKREYIIAQQLFEKGKVVINNKNKDGKYKLVSLGKDQFALLLHLAMGMHSLKMLATIAQAEKERDNQTQEGNVVPFVRP